MAILIRTLLILLALTGAVLTGCTPASTREALARADSIMVAAPDSALAILDALDPATLTSDETRAMYAVSLTEARHMAYVPVYDDSLITMGADYYLTHGSSDEKARAFYYSAIVRYNNSNYEQAIVDGLRAEKHALTTSDHLRLGLIYRTIADCFRALYDASSAIHYYTVSYEHFRLASTQKYTGWGLVDLSRANIVKGDNETALKFAYEALGYADSVGNDDLKVSAHRHIADAMFYMRKYDKTIVHYEIARKIHPNSLIDDDYEVLGESYLITGNRPKAQECQDTLDARQSDTYGLQVMLYEKAGKFESANRLHGKMLEYQNNEVEKLFTRNYARTISEYYKTEENNMAIRLSTQTKYTILICVIAVLAITIVIIINAYRIKLFKKNIDNYIFTAQSLREGLLSKENHVRALTVELENKENRLAASSSESESLQSEIRHLHTLIDNMDAEITSLGLERERLESSSKAEIMSLFSGRFAIVDRLCSLYYQHKSIPNMQSKIVEEVMKTVNDIACDKNFIPKIEENINRYMNNLMVDFRKDFPAFNEWEYTIYMFLVLRFSTNTMCVFLNIKPETLYNRKSSLKRKILKSDNTGKYLAFL